MAKEAKKVPPRQRRSKPEVEQAFLDIREELAQAEPPEPKSIEAERVRETAIRDAVETVSVESVVRKISGLGLEVSRALSNVAEQLAAEVELLASVRSAVALERTELDRLHKIDIAATAIDHLVQDHAQRKAAFDAETEEQRQAWDDETQSSARDRKEQEEALKKQRQREVEEYEYKKNLDRKKAQDKYDEEIRARDKKNQERQETLEKDWHRREAAIKEREAEFERLARDAAELPARLAKETEAAAQAARKETEARLQQEMLILKKDAETDRRVAQLQIKTLEDQLSRSAAQLSALEKQLADAKQQVQDIAVKAIEGASGARTLSHVNQIAMEQAKNRPQG